MFNRVLGEIVRHTITRSGTRSGNLFKILAKSLMKCGSQPAFLRSARFLMVMYEDIMVVDTKEEEMQTFIMLGYLRKLICGMLDGFMDSWRKENSETDEYPPVSKGVQQQALQKELKALRTYSDNNLGTWNELYTTTFADAYQKVGVTPGFYYAGEIVDAFSDELTSDQLGLQAVFDLARYMQLLTTEFSRLLLEATEVRKDDIAELRREEEYYVSGTDYDGNEDEEGGNGGEAEVVVEDEGLGSHIRNQLREGSAEISG
jgi:hypothetical protein